MAALVDDLLVAAAAGGLPGSLREFPDTPVPEPEALEVVRAAERLGIAGFMLRAVRDGGLVLPPLAIAALDEAQSQEYTTRRYLEQELLSVSRLLEDAEIQSRVLEGCAVAHLDYRDPDLRAVTRLDLLVHPRNLVRAAEVLRRRGWRSPTGSVPPRVPDGRTKRGLTFIGPSGPRLVLHDGIDGVPELSVDHGQLWADGDPFAVSGRRLKALGGEQRLLYTSALALDPHAALSLVPQRDLVQIVLFGDWRRPRLMELAVSWNVQEVLAGAVHTAWQRLAIADVTGLSVWAEGYRAEARRNARRHPAAVPDPRTRAGSWARLRTRLARHQ
jgi:hypothetical protein